MKAWPLLILGLVLACAGYLLLAPAVPAEDDASAARAGVESGPGAATSEDSGGRAEEASYRRDEQATAAPAVAAVDDADAFAPLPAVDGPAASLRLRLVDGDGRPAAGAHARLELRLWEFPEPEDGVADRFAAWREAELKAGPDAEGWVEAAIPAGVAVQLRAGGPHWRFETRELQRIRDGEHIDLGEIALAGAREVRGTVVGPQGAPVAGAQVKLTEATGMMWYGGSTWQAETEADGGFAIGSVPGGRYQVEVKAQGHALLQQDGLEVPEGGGPHPLDLELQAGRTVRGIVLDQDRNPVADARVFLFAATDDKTWWGDWRPPLPKAEDAEPAARTAADGSFEIGGVGDEGAYYVGADAEGHAAGFADVAEPGAQLMVTLARHCLFAGRVADADGQGVAGATVKLLRPNNWGGEPQEVGSVESAADGGFRFEPQGKGKYLLAVDSPLGGVDGLNVDLERDVEDFVVRLEPTSELVVVVRNDDDAPLANAQVTVSARDDGGEQVRFHQGLGHLDERVIYSRGGGMSRSGRTDAEGRVRFGGLDPREYQLTASVDGYARYQETVARSGGDQTVEVELHRGSGLVVLVRGTSGNPVRNLPVKLSGAADGKDHGERSTDSAGRAVWKDLEPGSYQVAYRPQDAEANGWWNRRNEQEEVAVDQPFVTLEGGKVAELEVTVQDLALAEVFVHRGGVPAGGVKVRVEKVRDEDQNGWYGDPDSGTPTDGRGEVDLPPVEPGAYELVVKASRNAPESRQRVDLHAGVQRLEVEVPGGGIRGRLVGTQGGVAGAKLSVVAASVFDEPEDGSSNHRGVSVMAWSGSGGSMTLEMGFADEQQSTTRSGEDGRFQFADVPDGEWVVIARAEGYGTWQSLPIAVRGGQMVELPTRRLMPGAVVHGRYLGWQPSPEQGRQGYFSWGDSVHLEDATGQMISMAQLGENGEYRFDNLPAGTFRVRYKRWRSEPQTLVDGEDRTLDIPVEEKDG